MINHKYSILALVLFLLTGCAPDISRRSILNDSMPKNIYYAEVGRKCDLVVGDVTDKRPANEVIEQELDQRNYRYVVPILPLWNQWSMAGPTFADPKYYDTDVTIGLQSAIKEILNKSNICSGDGSMYIVNVELLHFYGVEYSKFSHMYAPLGGFVFEDHNFFPTGYASINISIKDKLNGTLIGTKVMSDSFLFNSEEPSLSAKHSSTTGVSARKDNHVQVAMIALKRLLSRLPSVVDDIVAGVAPIAKSSVIQNTDFEIMRLTKEYDFIEKMNVDFDTGKIIEDKIIPRELPVISRPNEWIVSPFNKDGKWMSTEDYQQLLSKIRMKYTVEFKSNVNAAVFLGSK